MSHSQFHCTGRAYLDMHGLIFETSICYWQDQPGRERKEPEDKDIVSGWAQAHLPWGRGICAGERARASGDGDGEEEPRARPPRRARPPANPHPKTPRTRARAHPKPPPFPTSPKNAGMAGRAWRGQRWASPPSPPTTGARTHTHPHQHPAHERGKPRDRAPRDRPRRGAWEKPDAHDSRVHTPKKDQGG